MLLIIKKLDIIMLSQVATNYTLCYFWSSEVSPSRPYLRTFDLRDYSPNVHHFKYHGVPLSKIHHWYVQAIS